LTAVIEWWLDKPDISMNPRQKLADEYSELFISTPGRLYIAALYVVIGI